MALTITFGAGLTAIDANTAQIEKDVSIQNWQGGAAFDVDYTTGDETSADIIPMVRPVGATSGYSKQQKQDSSGICSEIKYSFSSNTGTESARFAHDFGVENEHCYIRVDTTGATPTGNITIKCKLVDPKK